VDKYEYIIVKLFTIPHREITVNIIGLKGQSHEIFLLWFFAQSVHSGPIRDALGPFGILANFHKVIGL